MFKSKIIEVIKTFSPEEIKGFRNYVRSPLHNSNKKVIKLFELLRKYYPDFTSKNIQKETLFKKLYPAKNYSDIVMRILISDMLRLAEEYLAYIGYSIDVIGSKKYLLKELDQRKLRTLFSRHIKEAEQLLEDREGINNDYFLNRFDIESAKFEYLISSDRQDRAGSILEKQGEYLVNYFLINSMNILQQINEMKEVVNFKYENNLAELFFSCIDIDSYMDKLKKCGYKHYSLIEIYYLLYKSGENVKNYDHNERLKNAVIGNLHIFDENERNNLLLAYESCAVTRIRYGLKKSKEDLMSVYEIMLKGISFSEKGKRYIQANLFRNIFYTALLLKKHDWAEEFVRKYSDYLLPEQRPDMLNYTGAMLLFERKKFDEAVELISRVNYSFFVFKYEAKVLMIKIYYELNLFEQDLSLIDSFSHFLTKNKNVSAEYKESFNNFLKFVKILIRQKNIPEKTSKFTVNEVLMKAESMDHFISKRWVLEKIKLLK